MAETAVLDFRFIAGGLRNARQVNLIIFGRNDSPHIETEDFPIDDPWSVYFRRTVADLARQGEFDGQVVTEFGAGDLRNLRMLAGHAIGFRAVEIDPNRVRIAELNLGIDPQVNALPHELVRADAVDFLDSWQQERPGETIGDWVFMCLPQSPRGDNSADTYDPSIDKLHPYQKWNRYGLTLNAAVLDKLRAVASPNLQVLIVNSHRVHKDIREAVISETGWEIKDEYISPLIQQDPDTPVGWIAENGIDDGKRFYEKTENGLLRAISAEEAELRRIQAVESGRGREGFNVYHQLSIYVLKPKQVCAV